jgi:hypothetical protein
MFLWLIRNYFKLSTFMNIEINPLAIFYDGLLWEVSYKKSHNSLNNEQKKLSDEFAVRLKDH